MVKSDFKFSTPKLIKLDFEINDGYEDNKKILTDNLNVSLNCHVDKEDEESASVSLEIRAGERGSEFPFFIHLVIGAVFKLDVKIPGIDFDNLLQINAPTLLLSYARPIISSITAQAGMKPLNLPFFNFIKQ
ncbi:MAG: protein-export chaperone SecB [Dorea sp.]|nr:protein-export chaperone SecB [Dorea sp.]